jgi:hypothetical protein
MEGDSAQHTTIAGAKLVPDGHDVSPEHSLIIISKDPKGLPLDMTPLREQAETGSRLEMPAQWLSTARSTVVAASRFSVVAIRPPP